MCPSCLAAGWGWGAGGARSIQGYVADTGTRCLELWCFDPKSMEQFPVHDLMPGEPQPGKQKAVCPFYRRENGVL